MLRYFVVKDVPGCGEMGATARFVELAKRIYVMHEGLHFVTLRRADSKGRINRMLTLGC